MTFEADAQRKAELHLEACYGLDEQDETEFCGCTTCIVREVLNAAVPDLYAALIATLATHDVIVPAGVAELFAEWP